MRALVLRDGALRVDEVAEPPLPPGHVLLETIACGICGTDLHCRHHAASFVAAAQRSGLRIFDFDPEADLVMGHELSGRVLACGEGVEDLPPGTLVAAHPLVRDAERAHAVGFSTPSYGPAVTPSASSCTRRGCWRCQPVRMPRSRR